MSNLREEQLLKALSDMEEIAKGGDSAMSGVGNKTPRTTAQANGGLSDEGDKKEMGVSSDTAKSDDDVDVEKGKASKQLSLKEWADEETTEHAKKGDDDSDDESEDYGDDDDDEDEGGGMSKGCKKSESLGDLLKSNSEVGPVFDAVPVLEQILDGVSDSDTELRKSIDGLTDHVQSQKDVIKSLAKVVLDVQEKLDSILDRPANGRKTVLSKSEVHERFQDDTPSSQMNKHQTVDTICEMIQKGLLPQHTVTLYESYGTLDPDSHKKLESYVLQKSA